jgi:hypothetical protein
MLRTRKPRTVSQSAKRRDKDLPNGEKRENPKYPIGPDYRMGHEGFLAGIGAWTGDLTKKASWLAPATGTVRNRPIEDLIDWLNANVTTERGKRLQQFVEDLKQVESLSKEFDFATADRFAPMVVPPAKDEPESLKAMRLAHACIQAACKRYCLYPQLTWVLWQKDWGLSFYTEGEVGELPVVYNGPSDFGRRVFEADAAIVVIGIAQRGEISRLRACEQCGSWFFASANTSHNARKFCSDSCRLKNFHKRRHEVKSDKARRSRRVRAVNPNDGGTSRGTVSSKL